MVSMSGSGYSCTTSTTSRPLYCPQCGQTRWGSFGSWQFGHSERPGAFSDRARGGSAVRRLECLRFGFGIVQPLLNSFSPAGRQLFKFRSALQRSSAASDLHSQSPSFRFLPHTGQMPLQSSLANLLHRQRQQHLLPEDVLQLHAVAFVKTDLRFALRRSRPLRRARLRRRAGKTNRTTHPGETRAAQAPVALRTHLHGELPLDADFTVRVGQQFSRTACLQRRRLLQVFSGKSIAPARRSRRNEPFAVPSL